MQRYEQYLFDLHFGQYFDIYFFLKKPITLIYNILEIILFPPTIAITFCFQGFAEISAVNERCRKRRQTKV